MAPLSPSLFSANPASPPAPRFPFPFDTPQLTLCSPLSSPRSLWTVPNLREPWQLSAMLLGLHEHPGALFGPLWRSSAVAAAERLGASIVPRARDPAPKAAGKAAAVAGSRGRASGFDQSRRAKESIRELEACVLLLLGSEPLKIPAGQQREE
jgi:hypothetical protein